MRNVFIYIKEAAFEIALHLWISGLWLDDPFYVSYIEKYMLVNIIWIRMGDIESLLSMVECWYDP